MISLTALAYAAGAAAAGYLLASSRPDVPWLSRSAECLSTLLPEVASRARRLITLAAARGIRLVATSCHRTLSEQEALYAKGRTAPGSVVTNAPPGTSWHNHQRAFDVAVLDASGQPSWPEDDLLWNEIGRLGESVGLSWGGRFGDRPHFDYHPGLSIAQARARARTA